MVKKRQEPESKFNEKDLVGSSQVTNANQAKLKLQN